MTAEPRPQRARERANGEGMIRGPRADGRYEARIRLPDGTRRSYFGKTRTEASRKMRAALTAAEAGTLPPAGKRLTVEAYLDNWLEAAKGRVEASTWASYDSYVRNHIVPAIGPIQLAKLRATDVEDMMAKSLKRTRTPKAKTRTVTASTANHARAVLRIALARAVKLRLIPTNVAELADPYTAEKPEIAVFTPEQAKTFLAATDGDRRGPLYAVALVYGLRLGECLGLRWEDVNLTSGAVAIRQGYQRVRGEDVWKAPKSAAGRRTLPPIPPGIAALRAERRKQIEDRLYAGEFWQEQGLVFAGPTGGPLSPSSVTKGLQKRLAELSMPRMRFHDLRHSCATVHLALGTPAKTVQALLGHSTVSLTLDTYSHVLPAVLGEAADRLTALYGDGPAKVNGGQMGVNQ